RGPGRRHGRRRSARSGSPAWCPPSRQHHAAPTPRQEDPEGYARIAMGRLAAIPGVVLVAVAAAMWGTNPIIRKTMSGTTSATTIVFGEHVILVALTLPLLFPALRAVVRAGSPYVAAAVVIGAGASAVATILFTDALIGHSDFITPVVIQKIQPFIAIGAAALLLGERARPGFWWFFLPALAGFWLVNQSRPLEPSATGIVVIAEATGAAALWG